MSNFIEVSIGTLERAMAVSSQENFNRSVDKEEIQPLLLKHLEAFCEALDVPFDEVMQWYGGDWKQVKIPVYLLQDHFHRRGEPCSPHKRISAFSEYGLILDVTCEDYQKMVKEGGKEVQAILAA